MRSDSEVLIVMKKAGMYNFI